MTSRPIAVVTGGAGFIGSHMVDLLLANNFDVRVIDSLVGGRLLNLAHIKNDPALSPRLQFEERDIRALSPGDPLFTGAKYVFHFAGIGDIVPSVEKPADYMSANVQGTVAVLECARTAKVEKLVYASSSSCFGLAEQIPTPETAEIQPQYPYALSKYMGEMSVLHWGKLYGLPVNCVRIFNAYGTRSRTSGAYGAVFGVFLRQKIAGRPLTVVGDGEQRRDFVFVTDVAEAFYQVAVKAPTGEVYNLGSGSKPPSVNDLVKLLDSETVQIPKRPGEPECTWADVTKLTTEIGWKPKVSFSEGVGRMLKVIDYWKEAPLWDQNSIKEATRPWFEAFDKQKGTT